MGKVKRGAISKSWPGASFSFDRKETTPLNVWRTRHPDLLPSGRGEGDGTRAAVVDHRFESYPVKTFGDGLAAFDADVIFIS